MTERKHELTDSELRELAGMIAADGSLAAAEPVSLLAALPSRQPKDPDAGLGKLPWQLGTYANTANYVADADGLIVAHTARYSTAFPPAVARAILAAPDGIKLAREVALPCPVTMTRKMWMDRLQALAAKVIAIADGTEGGK